MKKKAKDLKPGEVFSMRVSTGLVDMPVLIVAAVKRFDGDLQVIPQHIPLDVITDLEVNCHGYAPMYHTSCDQFETGLMDILEGYVEYE